MLPMDAIQAIFKIFPVLGRHDFQHHTGKKRLDPRQQDKATGDQWKTGTNRIAETAINNRASIPKKCSGL